jgi:F-type H+-transporting ATPase subunit epsilon
MDFASGKSLQCVVVTPERAVLDEPADFVALPMYDGELGVLPGRAPLIGRLGVGELRILQHGAPQRYFVDGGFAQVRADVVTVLTNKAMPAAEIDPAAANQQLAAAQAIMPKSPEEQAARERAEQRARSMLRVADKAAAGGGH